MNKEELNCYHKIFAIIRKTDLLNYDEKDELHLFLMKFKDENKELHNKIDKAIEYINIVAIATNKPQYFQKIKDTIWGEELLEILKGDVDDY